MKTTLFFLLLTFNIFAQIQRTEPPHWYAHMNNPDLQIMFYGKNIAQHDVSVSNNIVIKNVVKTENPNYIFVTIDTKNVPPSELIFSFKSKNKTAFTKPYSLKQRREGSAQRTSFDASDLI